MIYVILKRQDILRIQYMIQNKSHVETVNFRLYFKVIFRQNEIQYFTTHIYTTRRERTYTTLTGITTYYLKSS